jgi:quercetin dioxygenase-like cupin family protein
MEPQAELSMYRISFEPVTEFPPSAADPTTSLLFVERGALTITLDVPVQLLRAIGEGIRFPEFGKEIPAGTEFMLNLGDSILVPSGSIGEVMNNGTETAVILIAELAPEGAFDDEDATPEP